MVSDKPKFSVGSGRSEYKKKRNNITFWGTVALLSAGGVAAYLLWGTEPEQQPAIAETSSAQEFQDGSGASAIANLDIEDPSPADIPDDTQIVITEDENSISEQEIQLLKEQNAQLVKQLEELQQQGADQLDVTGIAEDNENDLLKSQIDQMEQTILELQAQQQASQLSIIDQENLAAEQAAQELLQDQINSSGVVYDRGKTPAENSTATPGAEGLNGGTGIQPQYDNQGNLIQGSNQRFDQDRDFVTGLSEAAPVEQASYIANPFNTIIEGTVIRATLDQAIQSSVAGRVVATINYDVDSYDGQNILIPKGSKLIGEYRSGLEIGDRRMLIGWNRIITTDNRTVNISAYGGNKIGISGLRGTIDNRVLERFGGALAFSLIESVPDIVGAKLAAQDDNVSFGIVADNASENISDAGSQFLEQQLNLNPIASIPQGHQVSVILDRDIEIW